MPPIITSVARLMPSITECRQPYRLSNFDLVTESLTLIAGNSSEPGLLHLVEPVDAGGRLLGDALDALGDSGPQLRVLGEGALEHVDDDVPLLRVVVGGVGHGARRLVLDALVHQQRGVAAVVDDQVGASRAAAVRPAQHLLGAPPVLLERLALPGEHRDALRVVGRAVGTDDHGGGSVVLGGEDVAARPAHVGAEGGEGLDEHGGLHRHVQRAGDAGALERLGIAVLGPQGHEPGHLVLGQFDLLATERSQGKVGDLEVIHVSEPPCALKGFGEGWDLLARSEQPGTRRVYSPDVGTDSSEGCTPVISPQVAGRLRQLARKG